MARTVVRVARASGLNLRNYPGNHHPAGIAIWVAQKVDQVRRERTGGPLPNADTPKIQKNRPSNSDLTKAEAARLLAQRERKAKQRTENWVKNKENDIVARVRIEAKRALGKDASDMEKQMWMEERVDEEYTRQMNHTASQLSEDINDLGPFQYGYAQHHYGKDTTSSARACLLLVDVLPGLTSSEPTERSTTAADNLIQALQHQKGSPAEHDFVTALRILSHNEELLEGIDLVYAYLFSPKPVMRAVRRIYSTSHASHDNVCASPEDVVTSTPRPDRQEFTTSRYPRRADLAIKKTDLDELSDIDFDEYQDYGLVYGPVTSQPQRRSLRLSRNSIVTENVSTSDAITDSLRSSSTSTLSSNPSDLSLVSPEVKTRSKKREVLDNVDHEFRAALTGHRHKTATSSSATNRLGIPSLRGFVSKSIPEDTHEEDHALADEGDEEETQQSSTRVIPTDTTVMRRSGAKTKPVSKMAANTTHTASSRKRSASTRVPAPRSSKSAKLAISPAETPSMIRQPILSSYSDSTEVYGEAVETPEQPLGHEGSVRSRVCDLSCLSKSEKLLAISEAMQDLPETDEEGECATANDLQDAVALACQPYCKCGDLSQNIAATQPRAQPGILDRDGTIDMTMGEPLADRAARKVPSTSRNTTTEIFETRDMAELFHEAAPAISVQSDHLTSGHLHNKGYGQSNPLPVLSVTPYPNEATMELKANGKGHIAQPRRVQTVLSPLVVLRSEATTRGIAVNSGMNIDTLRILIQVHDQAFAAGRQHCPSRSRMTAPDYAPTSHPASIEDFLQEPEYPQQALSRHSSKIQDGAPPAAGNADERLRHRKTVWW